MPLDLDPQVTEIATTDRDCGRCGAEGSGLRFTIEVYVAGTDRVIDRMTTEGCGVCGHLIPPEVPADG